MQSCRSISENELVLSYAIDPLFKSASTKNERVIVIVLLFLPNTREGVDMTNAVDSYVQANNVPGLIWHVLSRARQCN